PVSAPARVLRDDRGRRLPPRLVPPHERRHRRATFRLAAVILRLRHLVRLARAGFVFAREGVLALVDPRPLPARAPVGLLLARLIERPTGAGAAVRLSAALTRLGPTYVKLGQFLATRPDVVGIALARDLENLQDKMAPFPQAEAEAAVVAALGRAGGDIFAAFRPALAAASIAPGHPPRIEGAP